MPPAWAARYVGIPFQDKGRDRDGLDCYGLLRLVLLERFTIALPTYTEGYVTATDRQEIAALLTEGREADGSWVTVTDPKPGDGILFRLKGAPTHVGVVAEPPWFLHVARGMATVLERWDRPKWAHRILGFYRHERMRAA